jgi:hypothetical protein
MNTRVTADFIMVDRPSRKFREKAIVAQDVDLAAAEIEF